MPPADKSPSPAQKQDPPTLDLGKLAGVVGLLGSDHAGERANAAQIADRMLRAAGVTWRDLIDSHHRADIATEATAELVAENTAMRAELAELRTTASAVALWSDAGAAITDTRRAAQWGLDLHQRGAVGLSDFEVDFLKTCAGWRGRLTPRQAPVFERIVKHIVARTGMTPPP